MTKDYINTRFSTIKEWEKAKRWAKIERSLISDRNAINTIFAA